MNEQDRNATPDSVPRAPTGETIPPVAAGGRSGPPIPPVVQDHTRVAVRHPAAESPAAGRPSRALAHDAAAFGLPAHPPCPFCATRHTELHSPFGPQLSVATYWCNDCRTPFELLKWRAANP